MAQPVATFDLRGATAAPAPHSHSHAHDGHAHAHGAQEHGHTHEHMDHPGKFTARELPNYEGRDWDERAFTIGALTRLPGPTDDAGIGGPVGSGKVRQVRSECH